LGRTTARRCEREISRNGSEAEKGRDQEEGASVLIQKIYKMYRYKKQHLEKR
jgi:hypothetical protein